MTPIEHQKRAFEPSELSLQACGG